MIFCLWCLISTRLAEEKVALLKQCEESVSLKAEETEQLKLQLEEVQQELQLTKNKVCFTGLQQKHFKLDYQLLQPIIMTEYDECL